MILCPSCLGSGLGHDGDGFVASCRSCRGEGEVPARDARGRFVPLPDLAAADQEDTDG